MPLVWVEVWSHRGMPKARLDEPVQWPGDHLVPDPEKDFLLSILGGERGGKGEATDQHTCRI